MWTKTIDSRRAHLVPQYSPYRFSSFTRDYHQSFSHAIIETNHLNKPPAAARKWLMKLSLWHWEMIWNCGSPSTTVLPSTRGHYSYLLIYEASNCKFISRPKATEQGEYLLGRCFAIFARDCVEAGNLLAFDAGGKELSQRSISVSLPSLAKDSWNKFVTRYSIPNFV